MILYHGGTDIIKKQVIKPSLTGRDFGTGFYCTDIRSQAEKWAMRQGRIRKRDAILNIYEFDLERAQNELKLRIFKDYSIEWLELVINCRKNPQYTHGLDIVYGKIANDDVGETVQAVVDGLMSYDFALQKLVFMPANNQYCFCSEKSLTYLKFTESVQLE
jgi:GTPase SAR1 family protein